MTSGDAQPRPLWLIGVIIVGRVVLSVSALLVMFYLAPFDRAIDGSALLILFAMLGILTVLIVILVRAILRSHFLASAPSRDSHWSFRSSF